MVVLHDTRPSEPKSLVERQVRKPAPAQQSQPQGPQTPRGQTEQPSEPAGGDAAAVLNAVDEDEEGVVEADCPSEFEYESNGEGGGED